MPGWSKSNPECPVDDKTRAWIDNRWAWLVTEFGAERLRSEPVILPTPEFFPDAFSWKPEDVDVMLKRICGYMDVPTQNVRLSFYEDDNPVHGESGRTTAAGLYYQEGEVFNISVAVATVKDPLALAATLFHEVGHIHLLGHGRISQDAEDHEPLTDLLTVFFGAGVISANARIRERSGQDGLMAYWSMSKQGYLDFSAYGYALALFAQAREEARPTWSNHLRPDVRSEFTKALRFLGSGRGPSSTSPIPPISQPSPEDAPAEREQVAEREEEDGAEATTSLGAPELLERYARGQRDFCKLDLQDLVLGGANLEGSNFSGTDFGGADLSDANLSDTDLQEADLEGAFLCRVNLRGADLRRADLQGADLTGADLTDADIRNSNFIGARLEKAILTGTRRNSGTNLSTVDLSLVVCDVELRKERLDGVMLTDKMSGRFGQIGTLAAIVLFTGLGALGGAVIGSVFDWMSGSRKEEVGTAIGALVCGLITFWKLVRAKMKAPK